MQHLIGWALLIAVFSFIMYGMLKSLGWRETLKTVVGSLTIATAIVGGVYLVNS